MATYTKIRLDFKEGPEGRFYRTLLVGGNPTLFELAVMLGTSLNCAYEHCFLITLSNGVKYVMAPFMESPSDGYRYLENYRLRELPDRFDFEYDTGDGWDFSCRILNRYEKYPSSKKLILLEGAGQGIWEDRISVLYQYFEGNIPPDFDGEDPDIGAYKPWNLELDKYGDFDAPLDIDSINQDLGRRYRRDLTMLQQGEAEYIDSNPRIDLEDFIPEDGETSGLIPERYLNEVRKLINCYGYVWDPLHKLAKEYGFAKAKTLVAATYTKFALISDSLGTPFDEEGFAKELKDLPGLVTGK